MRFIFLFFFLIGILISGWAQPAAVKEVEQILAKASSRSSASAVTEAICSKLEQKYRYVSTGQAVRAVMAQLVNQHRKIKVESNIAVLKRTVYAHMLATAASYGQGYGEHRENQCRDARSKLASALSELPGVISAFLQCVDRNRDHISPDMIVAPQGLGPPLPPGVNYVQRPEDVPMYELPDFLRQLRDHGADNQQYCLQELIDVRQAQSWIAYLISSIAHFCD
ncbi:MAG: hypothetical protein KDC80_14955 [Saprospiraceae bacterium]|nr:hypothetical protein [Saprospiraceae bacterium]